MFSLVFPAGWTGILVLLLAVAEISHGDEFYVAVDERDCPGNAAECHNLTHYTSLLNPFINNSIVYFLEGTHVLEQDNHFEISRVDNLTLRGLGRMKQGWSEDVWESSSVITCSNHTGGILFSKCSNLEIVFLTITHCGSQITEEMVEYLSNRSSIWGFASLDKASYGLVLFDGIDLLMDGLSVQNGTGFGLATFNTFNIRVTNSSFSRNNRGNVCVGDPKCAGGNAMFLYYDVHVETTNITTNSTTCIQNHGQIYHLDISHSNFSFGIDNSSTLVIGSGLGVNVLTSTNYTVVVSMNFLLLCNNNALFGGNLFLQIAANTAVSSITIKNTRIRSGASYQGAGLYYTNSIYNIPPCTANTGGTNELVISNSDFLGNMAMTEGAGAWIGILPQTEVIKKIVSFTSCLFIGNIGQDGVQGSGLHAFQLSQFTQDSLVDFLFTNTTFMNNVNRKISNSSKTRSVVSLESLHKVTMNGVKIYNHDSVGIRLYHSTLTLSGQDTVIASNNGTTDGNGGGIYLSGDSHLIFRSPVHLTLINNTAERGGAIYIESNSIPDVVHPCFFQVNDPDNILNPDDSPIPDVTVHAYNNTATVTGDLLYGSDIESCSLVTPSEYLFGYTSKDVFSILFNYSENYQHRLVSSDPQDVCFCDENGLPDCNVSNKTVSAAPGEKFEFSVAAVGLFEGFAPGRIKAEIYSNRVSHGLLYEQGESHCTNMSFSVDFNATNASIYLSVVGVDNEYKRLPFINVTLHPCPAGFSFSDSSKVCDCDTTIMSLIDNATCDVSAMSITRVGDNWIAFNFEDNCTIAHNDCPFSYCNAESVTFTMNETDLQCLSNRTGILCGMCGENLSLVLGSNNCMKCSNAYLTLLIPFALLGLLLVALLIALNLTVAVGTINGLIFYANIVKINEPLFFPGGSHGSIPFLSQFISWINLDFGIETCFFSGMDAYIKTWLQFVFPLYIWLLVIAIIVISPYSKILSRLTGSNAVPVLGTLVLLSYTKVLRAVIQSLIIAYVSCGGSLRRVWAFDANIDYFSGPHLVLFIFALAVFLLVALPYTLLVLFNPVMEGYLSQFRHFKWLARLKPYYDAYSGPYKDRFRFWPGILLLARLVLALVIPFNSGNTNLSVILTVILLLMVTAWNMNGVYNNGYLDLLESWFLLNTALYCVFAFAEHATEGGKVTVSLVFLTFVGIVVFHLYLQLKKTKHGEKIDQRFRTWISRKFSKESAEDNLVDSSSKTCYVDNELLASTTVVRRRESLLSDEYKDFEGVNSRSRTRYSVIQI